MATESDRRRWRVDRARSAQNRRLPGSLSFRARLAASGALCGAVAVLLVAAQLPAQALTSWDTPQPVTGNATWFYALGGPYGGCGMPQADLESQDFVALNVYDLPGDYSTFYNRPMDSSLASKMGMWNNGRNCGRWVQVTIGDYCTGINDGQPNQPFCREGEWISDRYNGATLNMLVADSCGDGNAWCRDDPYHLDLAKGSLNRFMKDGAPVGDMDPDHWNNRKITWKFIPAPDYTGDIQIGFLQSAQPWWPAISVSRLPNGLHGVEYLQDGTWKSATMNGDMGQSYIIGGTTQGGSQFRIRVRDVNDQLINNGRVYNFTFPESCSPICNGAYTLASYTTDDATSPTGPTPTSTAPTSPTSTTPTSTTPTSTVPQPVCTATFRATQTWMGGFMAEVTVTAGNAPIAGWSVAMTLANDQTVGDLWNGVKSTNGSTVTVTNAPYNAQLAAGASTSFGFIGSGPATAPALTCASA